MIGSAFSTSGSCCCSVRQRSSDSLSVLVTPTRYDAGAGLRGGGVTLPDERIEAAARLITGWPAERATQPPSPRGPCSGSCGHEGVRRCKTRSCGAFSGPAPRTVRGAMDVHGQGTVDAAFGRLPAGRRHGDQGLGQGVAGMKVGGRRQLVIPGGATLSRSLPPIDDGARPPLDRPLSRRRLLLAGRRGSFPPAARRRSPARRPP